VFLNAQRKESKTKGMKRNSKALPKPTKVKNRDPEMLLMNTTEMDTERRYSRKDASYTSY
jgi:hypothetical protein